MALSIDYQSTDYFIKNSMCPMYFRIECIILLKEELGSCRILMNQLAEETKEPLCVLEQFFAGYNDISACINNQEDLAEIIQAISNSLQVMIWKVGRISINGAMLLKNR